VLVASDNDCQQVIPLTFRNLFCGTLMLSAEAAQR